MTELSEIFERLGLLQYLESFVDEGFDTWEIVLYATESDLEALGVKLGHRRKLQKEIAEARGITIEQVIGAIARTQAADDFAHGDFDTRSITSQGDLKNVSPGPSKRKYRRHPKPDENAPERPPSAYVIFSNKTREELKPQKLTFTDIAKTVGERWQVLDPDEKEQFESQAATAKEQYNSALTKYKRTSQYREYQKYLAEFKARNTPQPIAGTKRPKLETEISGASSGSGGSINAFFNDPDLRRKDSLASQPAYSPPISSAASPTAVPRITSRSRDSSVHSSVPSTPLNAGFPPSGSIHHPSGTRNYDGQSHSLPRIVPLDSRDSRPHISSLISEPSSLGNPRRSAAASPAAFLRQETSKSSTSSSYSRDSTVSSVYTPITPIEEGRVGRSLPPIPGLSHHNSVDSAVSSAVSSDSDRRVAQGLSPRYVADYSDHTNKQPGGYPPSFRHLSLHSDSRDGPRSSQPQIHDPSTLNRLPQPGETGTRPVSQVPKADQPDAERMDSLSVLALAGRMVDRDYSDISEATKRK